MERCCTARQGRNNNLTNKTAECIWFTYLHHKVDRTKGRKRRKEKRLYGQLLAELECQAGGTRISRHSSSSSSGRSAVTLGRASDGAGGREGVKVESLADILGGARSARSARDSSPGRRGRGRGRGRGSSSGGGGGERSARSAVGGGPPSLGRAGSDVDKVCKVEGLGRCGRGEQLVGSGVLGRRRRGEEVVAAGSRGSRSSRCSSSSSSCSGRLAVDGCWSGRVGEVEEQVSAGA